jgi:plasmid rolling circle replication initiator protein Rep
MRSRRVSRSSLGAYRNIEITINKKTSTYHPHIHAIVCVPYYYFDDRKLFISQQEWCGLWKETLGLSYVPICDVRAIKENAAIKSSIAEVAKYVSKSWEYLSGPPEEIDNYVFHLTDAIHYRRLISYSGNLKQIHSLLNLEDAEDGDLINLLADADDKARSCAYLYFKFCNSTAKYRLLRTAIDLGREPSKNGSKRENPVHK